MNKQMKYPILNENLVLREEFDDWAIVFDPDTGNTFTLNPIAVMILKLIDGKTTIKTIINNLQENFENIPKDVDKDVNEFISNLENQGFIGYTY